MIKNQLVLEVVKENRNYTFVMENNSPLGEIHDALSEMKDFIIKQILEIQAKEKPAAVASDNS